MNRERITERECYGCMLCASRCPVKAIDFTNDECGFPYPTIDKKKCIDCGLCEKLCIANNPPIRTQLLEEAYSASLLNKDDLLRSASGGAAYALGLAQLSFEGVVYGVAFTSDFRSAEYVRVEKKSDLVRLQDTKYFHANAESKRDLFVEIDQDLKNKHSVLVVGLPCEIAALRKLFGTDSYLTLVELFCHGVTSHEAHKKYLNSVAGGKDIISFSVKAKLNGWKKNSFIQLNTKDGTTIQEPFYSSAYGYAFAHLARKSCYGCHFKGDNRVADLSIGDYWGILQQDKKYEKNGVSVIQVHTDQGKKLVQSCEELLHITSISSDEATADNAWVEKTIPIGDRKAYAEHFASAKKIYIPIQVKLRRTIKTVFGRQCIQEGICTYEKSHVGLRHETRSNQDVSTGK